MPGPPNPCPGLQIHAWASKSMPGTLNPCLGLQIHAWASKSLPGALLLCALGISRVGAPGWNGWNLGASAALNPKRLYFGWVPGFSQLGGIFKHMPPFLGAWFALSQNISLYYDRAPPPYLKKRVAPYFESQLARAVDTLNSTPPAWADPTHTGKRTGVQHHGGLRVVLYRWF